MKLSEILGVAAEYIFFGALIFLAAGIVQRVKKLVDVKIKETSEKIKNRIAQKAVGIAEDSINTVVLELSQTKIDGSLTSSDIEKIKKEALLKVERLLSGDVCDILIMEYGNASEWLKSKIEAALQKSKSERL